MKNYLKKLPEGMRNLMHLAGEVAFKNNMPVYLVGGCVRDLLLGVKNLDLDIVVEGDGIRFAEGFANKLKARLIRHRRFGTATVLLEPNLKIDIATARRESYPKPASLPEVTNGTLKDDLFRRDFTINAMAIDIGERNFARLIDLFKAKVDLLNKKIRILHSLSFIDDPTRILRAIRFERRYNFRIEADTLELLKEAVKLKMLERVHSHRLRDELILILKEGHPIKQIRRIEELTGFDFISQKLNISATTYKLLSSIERQIHRFKKIYSKRRQLDSWLIYFIGLADSLGKGEVKSICKKFAFRKGEQKIISVSHKISPYFIRKLSQGKIKPSRVFSLLEPLSYESIILIKAKYKNRNIKKHIEDFFKIYNTTRLHISGEDLHRLGIAPGPKYQKLLTKVLNAKLNGRVKTKKEELALINKLK